jgi:hypothetical protein
MGESSANDAPAKQDGATCNDSGKSQNIPDDFQIMKPSSVTVR